MPASTSMAAAVTAAQMRPGAGAVGDVDRVGQTLERHRLGEQVAAVERYRRRHLGGEHEARGLELFLQVFMRNQVAKLCGPGKRNNETLTDRHSCCARQKR